MIHWPWKNLNPTRLLFTTSPLTHPSLSIPSPSPWVVDHQKMSTSHSLQDPPPVSNTRWREGGSREDLILILTAGIGKGMPSLRSKSQDESMPGTNRDPAGGLLWKKRKDASKAVHEKHGRKESFSTDLKHFIEMTRSEGFVQVWKFGWHHGLGGSPFFFCRIRNYRLLPYTKRVSYQWRGGQWSCTTFVLDTVQ